MCDVERVGEVVRGCWDEAELGEWGKKGRRK